MSLEKALQLESSEESSDTEAEEGSNSETSDNKSLKLFRASKKLSISKQQRRVTDVRRIPAGNRRVHQRSVASMLRKGLGSI